MPNTYELLDEIRQSKLTPHQLLLKYLKKLSSITNRNTILYYSGWLEKPHMYKFTSIDDKDMNSLTTVVHKLDTSKGLDLILHTPGGEIGPTISIVNYLHSVFENNIRAIIPL